MNGRCGDSSALAEIAQLFLHQETGGTLRDEVRHRLGGSVGAVGAAERVVDVDVGVARQRLRELAVVGFFLGMEAQVLEQRDVAPVGIDDDLAGTVAHRLVGQPDVGVDQLGQPRGDRFQRVLLVGLSLGPPQVRGEHDTRPLLDRQLDGGEALPNSGVIADGATGGQRDVEIDADEDPLPVDVQLRNRLDRHRFVLRPVVPQKCDRTKKSAPGGGARRMLQ